MDLGLSLSLSATRRARGFSPAVLFANSEPGVWLDPSDPAAVFSDTAGTTQAGIGDPVALMLDKSGNDHHATQPTLASRPILREADGLRYLSFDGVDDSLVTPTITPGTDKAQVFAGVRALDLTSDGAASIGMLVEIGSTGFNATNLHVPTSFSGQIRFTHSGDTNVRSVILSELSSPFSAVLSGISDLGAPQVLLRHDGSQVSQDSGATGGGVFNANPVFIGAQGGTIRLFNGHIYGLTVRFGPNLDLATIERTERYVAKRTGVTL